MLQEKGLKKGDYKVKAIGATHCASQAMLNDKNIAAAILSPPADHSGAARRSENFGTAVSVVGPYQSDAGWVLRSWGQANADT